MSKTNTFPSYSPDARVEERRCKIEERTGTFDIGVHADGAKMASWVPIDNSSLEISKILRAFSSLLKGGEAPRVDSLVKMAKSA